MFCHLLRLGAVKLVDEVGERMRLLEKHHVAAEAVPPHCGRANAQKRGGYWADRGDKTGFG